MKNHFVLGILIACSVQIASGQISSPIMKKSCLLGGAFTINYENETYKDTDMAFYTKSFSIGTDAYCGYFLSNHVALGLLTDISIKNSKKSNTLNDYTSNEISNNYSFGPFLRYYTTPGIFFECGVGMGYWHLGNNSNPNRMRSYSFGTGVGYSIFITNSIALEPQLKYKYDKIYWSSEDQPDRTISGIYFLLGLQFYLPTNK